MSDKRKLQSMENLEKCYKVVQQSSSGISAISIAKKLKPGREEAYRTTVHRYLNTLELKGRVYSQHGLWYPKETEGKDRTPIQDYLIERFWREEKEVENENLNGDPFKAYNKAKFLSIKLPSPYKERIAKTFEKVKKEVNAIPLPNLIHTLLLKPEEIGRERRKYLRDIGIPLIVENISEVLHEMEKSS